MDDIPERVIQNLRRFNRKERYYLIGVALGNPKFKLGGSFRRELQECLHLPVPVPENAFVAMDYHLDWVYASLFLADKGMDVDGVVGKPFVLPRCKEITATQQDIDLLMAYCEDNQCHLLFLEAKGPSGFINEQLNSRAKRLKGIFGENGSKWEGVTSHLALISPRKPKRLKPIGWPKWMLKGENPAWVPLDWPEVLVSVSRSNKHGNPLAAGDHWTVLQA